MRFNITADDLIRYIYGETTPMENLAIQHQIRRDKQLRAEYEQLQTVCLGLDQLSHQSEPNPDALQQVLNYSRLSNLQTEFTA